MGDAGLALAPDANAMHFNASNLVFAEDQSGFSFTYTPWLRNLNLDDIFLLYVSGFYKLSEDEASKELISLPDKYEKDRKVTISINNVIVDL